jgi:hypothetical protein
MKLLSSVTILFLLITGCTYAPPPLDPAELALVRARRKGVTIIAVDGKVTKNLFEYIGGWAKEVQLEAGEHSLRVQYDNFPNFPPIVEKDYMSIIAEPGRLYLLDVHVNGLDAQFWIEDKETGQVIESK